jgi:hypothetical protein
MEQIYVKADSRLSGQGILSFHGSWNLMTVFITFRDMYLTETTLTHILLTWSIGWAPNNASKWQTGFNSAFKGLTCGKIDFITAIMVNMKIFWDLKPCLLVNSHSLYQFTRREATEDSKVFGSNIKWATTTSSLSEFAKLRNITISFMSVCLSFVRMEELGTQRQDFYEIWCSSIFTKICGDNSSYIQIWQE